MTADRETDQDAASVRLAFDGPIARVTLNRAAVGNALDLPTVGEFAVAVREIGVHQPAVQLIVLASAGRAFCVGGDIRAMAESADPTAFIGALAQQFHGALLELRSLAVPILAVVQGAVAGGGLGLVLAADLVLAAEDARFVAAYSGVGLSPDSGVSALLPSVLGVRRAALFLLTNRALTATQALEWGLISEVVAPALLSDRAQALEQSILAAWSPALGETARLLRQSAEQSYADQLAEEALTIVAMRGTELAQTRISAFVSAQRGASS